MPGTDDDRMTRSLADPTDTPLDELLDVAVRVATEAAELVLAARRTAVAEVDTKSSETDVVTAADRAAEQLVRDRLAEWRPGEPVLGEEAGGAPGDDLTWVVDPIDGTVNYLYGFPWYAVSVAVQRAGRSLVGAVVEPVSGRTWTAVLGRGAHLDGQPLRVSAATRLDLSLVATGFAYSARRRERQARAAAELIPVVRDVRRAGAASLDLCAVAAGWLDGYVEHGLNRWDWAAGGLIAAEAGAVFLPPGEAPELGVDATFAVTPGIAEDLRAALVTAGFGNV